jgi:hypothetical protein
LVTPLAPPRLIRHCPGCRETKAFVCAESFRVNAQKKIVDVWLNYRCERCDEVWKAPVLERTAVSSIGTDQLDAFFRNDAALVRRHAFDVTRLRRLRIDASTTVEVQRSPTTPGDSFAPLSIRLSVPLPCAIRLDRLLAAELCLPRGELQCLYENGRLLVYPPRNKPLRARVHDGQHLLLLS